jgi:hypothetical protein
MEPQVTDGFGVPRGCGSIVRDRAADVVDVVRCGSAALSVHRYSPCDSTAYGAQSTPRGGGRQDCLACCLIRMVSSLTVL